MNIFKVFGSSKQSKTTIGDFYSSLYPESVRYALQYNGAEMGPAEIRSLVDRFTQEALYLIVKAFTDREQKRAYIEDLTRVFVQDDEDEALLKACLYDWIDRLPASTRVKGTKLAQLSRSGSGNWQDQFKDLAQSCYDEDQSALPCLIAHTAILGYRHFVKLYRDLPKADIVLLIPEWMADDEENFMGYSVRVTPEVRVTLQPKDRCIVASWKCGKHACKFNHVHCGNSFFVDDTIHSGATAGKITSFWYSEYGLNVPNDKIKVITDLRGHQSA